MLVVLLLPLSLAAQEDAEGCKDSPVLTRMPKCVIGECSKKEFDAFEFIQDYVAEKKQNVEGAKETITYGCDESVSHLNIARNAEAALKKAGFTIVFSGKGDNDWPMVTARKGATWIAVNPHDGGYTQTVVISKAMEETMVASAAELEAEINKTGSCSIYGVLFDTGKADILPDSAKCLDEVVKLLGANPTWKMQVEGHTDNVGGSAANQKLSQARAEAVKAWLVAKGVPAARLTAKGFGDSQPISDNKTEDGRAKNRRVTLRKIG